jgi:hypothetical protein
MRSAPCASAPSHPLHAMPPRITRNSDRPRASDRTMVNFILLAASCTLEPFATSSRASLRDGHQAESPQGTEIRWAGSRERISIFRLRRSFFLDIPFYRTYRVDDVLYTGSNEKLLSFTTGGSLHKAFPPGTEFSVRLKPQKSLGIYCARTGSVRVAHDAWSTMSLGF